MRTDELIETLTADLRPVPAHAAARLLAAAAALGGAVSALLLATWLGVRPDWAQAALDRTLWLKLGFVISVGAAALVIVRQLGRPEARVRRLWWLLIAPFVAMALLGAIEIIGAPAGLRWQTWLGATSQVCSSRIVIFSGPITLALLWPIRRRLAPTRPALTGLAVGLAAGGLGAAVYALYCTESSAAFMATWYGLGMGLSGIIGAAAGALWLRW